jgi:hypothetical protein
VKETADYDVWSRPICHKTGVKPNHAYIETVETRDDRIMLSQRGVLFQVGGKFPRMTGTTPEEKLTEITKVLESLLSKATGTH